MKIYTKKGDEGSSSLSNGSRFSKSHDIFACLGTLDELNSSIGVAAEFAPESIIQYIRDVQHQLLYIGSVISTSPGLALTTSNATTHDCFLCHSDKKCIFKQHLQNATSELEITIDGIETLLPKLTNFILPSGGKCSSFLHLARTICRRAERKLSKLKQECLHINHMKEVMMYVNRLSDYLFVLARYACQLDCQTETIHK